MLLNPFKAKHVLITGGSTGLGLALAKAFARERAHVALVDADKDLLAQAQREIEGMGMGIRCVTYAGDISNGAVLRDYISMVQYDFGSLEGIIACPDPISTASLEEIEHDAIDRDIDRHVKGALHVLSAGVPLLAENNHLGGFVGLVVMGGREVSASAAATQAALTAIAHSIRPECARGRVRVHVLIPPIGIQDSQQPAVAKKFIRGVANHRKTVIYGVGTRVRRFTLRHVPLIWRLFFSRPKWVKEADVEHVTTTDIDPVKASEVPIPKKEEARRVVAGDSSSGFTLFNQTLLKEVIVSMETKEVKGFLHTLTRYVGDFEEYIVDIVQDIATMDREYESSWEFEVAYEERQVPFQLDVSLNTHDVVTLHFHTTPKLALIIDHEFGESLSA